MHLLYLWFCHCFWLCHYFWLGGYLDLLDCWFSSNLRISRYLHLLGVRQLRDFNLRFSLNCCLRH